jgi:hypothetical protein
LLCFALLCVATERLPDDMRRAFADSDDEEGEFEELAVRVLACSASVGMTSAVVVALV